MLKKKKKIGEATENDQDKSQELIDELKKKELSSHYREEKLLIGSNLYSVKRHKSQAEVLTAVQANKEKHRMTFSTISHTNRPSTSMLNRKLEEGNKSIENSNKPEYLFKKPKEAIFFNKSQTDNLLAKPKSKRPISSDSKLKNKYIHHVKRQYFSQDFGALVNHHLLISSHLPL